MKHVTTDKLLSLGMALHADRRTMEMRVRSIFARRKSAWFASLAAVVLCGVIGVLGFTTACRPAAEESAAQAGTATAQNLTSVQTLVQRFPTAWQETLGMQNGAVQVEIAAELVLPDAADIPVLEVAPDAIEMETAAQLARYVAGNGSIAAEGSAGGEARYSMETIDEWIAQVSTQLGNVENYHADNPNIDMAEMTAELEAELARLVEMRQAAQPRTQIKLDDLASLAPQSRVQGFLHDEAGREIASILIRPSGGEQDDTRESQLYISALEAGRQIAQQPIDTIEQAVAVCDAIMSDIGLSDDYTVVSRRDHEGETAFGVYYGRVVDGIPYSPLVERPVEPDAMNRIAWPDERIEFCIGKGTQHIKLLTWRGNSTLVRQREASAALCDFSIIQQACRDALTARFSNTSFTGASISVERMHLGYTRMENPDGSGTYLLVPAWTLTGALTMPEGEVVSLTNDVILLVNATDASVLYCWDEEIL